MDLTHSHSSSLRRNVRRAAFGTLALVVVALLATGIVYRRQIVSLLTHWKGGPSSRWVFVPHSPSPSVRIAVVGDTGDSGSHLDAIARAMDALGVSDPYDALLLLGDNVYPNGNPDRLPETVFGPFGPTLGRGASLHAILGNHDVSAGFGEAQMAALGQPGRWWSVRLGDVLVVGLDSNDLDDPDQLEFLDEALRSTDARWRIVALHHPPYSAGYQGSSQRTREFIAPIAARHGVQLVLSGHDHDYQRSIPIDGVIYVVSGAGSGSRRTSDEWFTDESWAEMHFLDLATVGDRLVIRAVDRDGLVFDEFSIDAPTP
jgi:predicted phosphodiesterase